MRNHLLRLGTAFILAALCFNSASALTLVKDGKATSLIVIGDKPLPWQTLAAEELQYHLKKMSGARVPIVKSKTALSSRKALIFVGQSARLSALGINTTKLKGETFIVKIAGNALVLAGEDGHLFKRKLRKSYVFHPYARTGTLFAVYDFLQDQLGCRWIWPGENGELIPRRSTIEVGNLDIRETPRIRQRKLRNPMVGRNKKRWVKRGLDRLLDMRKTWDKVAWDQALWLKRMKMGRSFYYRAGHGFTHWWKKYGKTDADVFALLPNGKRGHRGRASFVKMCVSSPKLWKMQLDAFAASRKAGSIFKSLNACENDGSGGFCTCPNCRAWDVKPDARTLALLKAGGPDGSDVDARLKPAKDGLPRSLSNRYCRWYNELAKRVRKIDPEAYVVAYAYSRYRSAPIGMKMEPNVLIGYVGFNAYPTTEETCKRQRADYLAWAKTGARLYFRPNSLYFVGHAVPFVFTRAIADDFKFLAANGMLSTDFDSLTGYWSTIGPTYYVLARLHWDTDADVDALLDEFYSAFGPMAPAAKEYFDYWEAFTKKTWLNPGLRKRAKKLSPTSGARGRVMVLPEFYKPKDFAAGRAILDKAKPLLAKAAPEERARFENLEFGLRNAELTVKALGNSKKLSKWRNSPLRGIADTIQELLALRRKIASRSVTNVYYLTAAELRLGDLTRLSIARDLGDREGIQRLNYTNWRFRFDPDHIGEKEGWHKKRYRSKAEDAGWVRGFLGRSVAQSRMGRAWKKEHGSDFKGDGWYRVNFRLQKDEDTRGLTLLFLGVTGSVRVWINGKQVADSTSSRQADSPATAKALPRPIEIDISKVANPRNRQTLIVKVSDKGGIVGKVYIVRNRKQTGK